MFNKLSFPEERSARFENVKALHRGIIELNEELFMKDLELRLIAELMRNSRRSDRALAKAIGTSQPTVTRTRRKLEKEGYFKEYTVIPDFKKLGFSLLSVTLTKLKQTFPDQVIEEKRKEMREKLEESPIPDILHMYGMGLEAERVIITLHANYSSYVQFVRRLRNNPLLEADAIRSFIVDLTDEKRHFRTLSMSQVANYLMKTKK
jgi:DNA-binding Lrp family transcriptional regulator